MFPLFTLKTPLSHSSCFRQLESPSQARHYVADFAGCDTQVERIHEAAKGRGGFVLIEGAAGMGKTALLRELEKLSVLDGLRVLKGSCSAIEEATPLYVFSLVMDNLLQDATPEMISGGKPVASAGKHPLGMTFSLASPNRGMEGMSRDDRDLGLGVAGSAGGAASQGGEFPRAIVGAHDTMGGHMPVRPPGADLLHRVLGGVLPARASPPSATHSPATAPDAANSSSKVASATTDDIGSACSGSASSSSSNKSACSAFLSTMANLSDAKQKNVKDLLSGSDPSVFKDMPLIAPLLGQEPMHNRYTVRLRAEERQTKLLGLCVQLLRAKCELHGTMLLLDNVQWMDEVSWQLVRKLHRELKELLIVAAFRTEAGPSATDAVGRVSTTASAPPPQRMTSMRTSQRHGNVKQAQITFLREVEKEENGIENFVKLKPLLEADLKDMAQKLLDAKELPPALSTFLVKKSEGNPFYMIEIMNFLKRKGYVSKDSDRVNILNDRFAAQFQQQFESIGLQKLLLASMENLQAKNPQEKANLEQVLKSASALGESFQSRQVRDLHLSLGLQPGPSKIDAILSKLRELKQFDYNSEQLAYSFRSSIGRDVIYTSLTFENRKRLHTAAAEVIMKTPSDGKPAGPRQFLTAFAHYRAAEDDAQQLSLLTDAAHQALTGTSWNETLDLLEQGEEMVNNYDQADAAMAEAVRKLPEGTLVLWEAMRGEALLGCQLPEQAYRTFKKAFKKGMDEAGIPLVVVEKDKGKKEIMANMFRKNSKKKEEVLELDGRVLPGLKSSLKAHTTLFRSLVEQAAEKGLEIADVLASLDKWAMGEHMRAALTAAAPPRGETAGSRTRTARRAQPLQAAPSASGPRCPLRQAAPLGGAAASALAATLASADGACGSSGAHRWRCRRRWSGC